MDAFEQVISEILWHQGYWVRTSLKVELTKEEKRAIGRPSSPRWEIDVVAYSARENVLRLVECKSYLDSPGVKASCFDGTDLSGATRYKLFNEAALREAVFHRVANQLYEIGACAANPTIKLCLACGKIASEKHRLQLRSHFEETLGSFGTSIGCMIGLQNYRKVAMKIRFHRSWPSFYCEESCLSSAICRAFSPQHFF